ncbi:MAG: CoA-binding protein [Pseudomonadota bacterium]
MSEPAYTDAFVSDILGRTRVVAMVGASANPSRPSYFVLKYLLAKGYTVHPINPGLAGTTLLKQHVYADLADVPAPVDMVDIFRNADAAGAIVDQAITLRETLGIKTVWMQLGVRNDEAAARAADAGLSVIMNRCPKIEYGRLSGEIGWAGVNSGVITSSRPKLAPGGVQAHVLGKR